MCIELTKCFEIKLGSQGRASWGGDIKLSSESETQQTSAFQAEETASVKQGEGARWILS